MNPQWLAVQSFQDSQNLLSAINTLSIHTKLEIAGRPDMKVDKQTILPFLEELRMLLEEHLENDTEQILGEI